MDLRQERRPAVHSPSPPQTFPPPALRHPRSLFALFALFACFGPAPVAAQAARRGAGPASLETRAKVREQPLSLDSEWHRVSLPRAWLPHAQLPHPWFQGFAHAPALSVVPQQRARLLSLSAARFSVREVLPVRAASTVGCLRDPFGSTNVALAAPESPAC